MSQPQRLTTPEGREIAFHQTTGAGVGVVFLGGFRSDMGGTKAVYLHDWAAAQGKPFLRFDYSGHGQSSGAFEDGCIGDWAADAAAVITARSTGRQILVGSSMGGWISLLLARAMPDRIAGIVGIAAAPDFTVQMEAEMTTADHAMMAARGYFEQPSDYAPEPYRITARLIDDGRRNQVLDRPLPLPFPMRLLQGTADTDVPPSVALRLMDHATCPDLRLTLVKWADHRFSTPDCLAMIAAAVKDIAQRAA